MVDVQLSGVAPAGGAGLASIAGSNAAAAHAAAAPGLPAATAGATAPVGQAAAAPLPAGAAQAAGTLPGAAKLDDLQLKDAVKNANEALAAIGTQLVFVFDDQAHHLAVKLLDIQTQKVVQQIPTAAMHATASALSGPSSSGALVDTKA